MRTQADCLNAEIDLLKSPWDGALQKLLSLAESQLLLASPFIKCDTADVIVTELTNRPATAPVRVHVLTNLRPESAVAGSLDLEAFINMDRDLPILEVTHVPCLHAKVYVADTRMAVITSANLTGPGIKTNVEYGVALTNHSLVAEIRRDFEGYARLGVKIPKPAMGELLAEIAELKHLFKTAERSIRSQARRAFKEKLEAAHIQILKQRAKGQTTHSILVDTIVFLLAKRALTTHELHPLIQALQPELCDDSIDRIIDGVHFGKRWKHYVRNAQQFLKRQGRVTFDGKKWHLREGQR